MGQHPVAQCARTATIDLLPQRVSHHDHDSEESGKSRQPPHRQPTAREYAVKPVSHQSANHYCRGNDDDQCPAHVPRTCERIALVNISSNGVCLILEDYAPCWSNL